MIGTERKVIVRFPGLATVGLVFASGPVFAADPILTCQIAKTKAADVLNTTPLAARAVRGGRN